MKNVGSTFEYEDMRNEDLMDAYREVLCSHNGSTKELYRKVVEMPARRFYVSEERASIVISNMYKGRSIAQMRPNKREMYEEIFRRVLELKKERPNDSIYDLTFEVVQQPSPKFYLTPESARVFICYIKKQWYEQRKKKYRHLFM